MRRQYTGLSWTPKRRDFNSLESVGELPMGGEAGGRPTVERMGVRMLA